MFMNKRERERDGITGVKKGYFLRDFMLSDSRIEKKKKTLKMQKKMGSLIICDLEEGEMRQPLGRRTSREMNPGEGTAMDPECFC